MKTCTIRILYMLDKRIYLHVPVEVSERIRDQYGISWWVQLVPAPKRAQWSVGGMAISSFRGRLATIRDVLEHHCIVQALERS